MWERIYPRLSQVIADKSAPTISNAHDPGHLFTTECIK